VSAAETFTLSTSELVQRIGDYLGATPPALLAARALVEAETLGDRAFGLELLGEGHTRSGSPPVAQERNIRWIDASRSFGPIAVATASMAAAATATEDDVGLCVVTGVGRLGRLATYAAWGAEQGFVTLVLADAPSAVVPAGGRTPVLGTNPVAVAVPGTPPFVTDFTTAAKTQAAAAAAGETGPLQPRGGLVGTLVGLVVGSLTGGLSGDVPSRQGRTISVLMVAPRDRKATSSLFERLENEFAESGARLPGRRARRVLDDRPTIELTRDRCGPLADCLDPAPASVERAVLDRSPERATGT
jgi:hypothetical protein